MRRKLRGGGERRGRGQRCGNYGTSVGGDGGDDEEEVEGDEELDEEGLGGADGWHGDAAGEEGVEDGLEGEGGADGCGDLGEDVGGDVGPGEVAQHREGDGEGRVEVGAGDVACGQDDDHDRQAGAGGVADEGLGPVVLLVHDRCRRGAKYEDECPHKFCSQLSHHQQL